MAWQQIVTGTAAELAAANPVLELNQLAVVTEVVDNVSTAARDAKLGDGVTRYNDLPYWPPGIDGDVQGPSSSTDNAIARFDSTTGKVIQNSAAFVDDNSNVYAPNVAGGSVSIATAAGTTTLTVASKGTQVFTGVTTQTIVLPVVTTLPQIGFGYHIINDSTGALTVNSSGSNLVQTIPAGGRALITCILLTGTSAALANLASTPTLDASSNPFIGLFDSCIDGSTGQPLTAMPTETLFDYEDTFFDNVALYNYAIVGNTIQHTRSTAKLVGCVWNRTTQDAAYDADGNSPLPPILANTWIAGVMANLGQVGWTDGAGVMPMYSNLYQQGIQVLRMGAGGVNLPLSSQNPISG